MAVLKEKSALKHMKIVLMKDTKNIDMHVIRGGFVCINNAIYSMCHLCYFLNVFE